MSEVATKLHISRRTAYRLRDRIAYSSPYMTGHLNRFGRYELNRERVPEPLESTRKFRMSPRGETNSRTVQVAV